MWPTSVGHTDLSTVQSEGLVSGTESNGGSWLMTDMHDRLRYRAAALAALLVLGLGAASCGDDDDDGGDGGNGRAAAQTQSQGDVDPASFDNTPEGQIRALHARAVNAIYSKDPERICQLSSDSAQRKWRGKNDSCEEGVKAYYKSIQSLSKDRPRIVKVRIQGSRALAQTRVKGSNIYASPFVKEDGEWKLDAGGS